MAASPSKLRITTGSSTMPRCPVAAREYPGMLPSHTLPRNLKRQKRVSFQEGRDRRPAKIPQSLEAAKGARDPPDRRLRRCDRRRLIATSAKAGQRRAAPQSRLCFAVVSCCLRSLVIIPVSFLPLFSPSRSPLHLTASPISFCLSRACCKNADERRDERRSEVCGDG